MTRLYGIPNCDTVKKARAWLAAHGVAHEFHDYKKQGIDAATLAGWAAAVGWNKLLNRSGTTFRKLPADAKADVTEREAIALMLAHPSLIKRPVLVTGGDPIVGFRPDLYAAVFSAAATEGSPK